jgi:serine/threonine protein kinase
LADGLAHAHERGTVHRDLKPANILLARDGTPLLLDFNLALGAKGTRAFKFFLWGADVRIATIRTTGRVTAWAA